MLKRVLAILNICNEHHKKKKKRRTKSECERKEKGRRKKTHSNELREFIRGHEMDKTSDVVKLFFKGFLNDEKRKVRE